MRRAIPADVESGTPSLASDTLLSGLQSEVTKLGRLVVDQLERALRCYHTRDLTLAEEIIERDDAVDNLNLELEERCFALAATGGLSEDGLRTVRATVKIALNLERIGDAGTHIAKRVRLLVREGIAPGNFTFEPLETCALTAVSEVIDAVVRRDLEQARRACLRESEFDTYYVACVTEARRQMQASPAEVPYLLHTLAVMKYLEKVADYVLNVGEQAIFLMTGRRLKFSQYQQLGLLMPEAAGGGLEFRPYWDGVSGAVVARVAGRHGTVLYKEGSRRKIQEETEKLKVWERIPGDLTPRVLGSVTVKDRQALLREFVDSTLLSELYLSDASRDAKLAATQRVLDAVRQVWQTTLVPTPPAVDYVAQIRRRLPEVFALHPELRAEAEAGISVDGAVVRLDDLLARAETLEPSLAPPCSVWLHGDFNANNVLYNDRTGQVKFIDVHRSRLGDYLQDISVFLLSMVRRPDLSATRRDDIARVNQMVEEFAREFATERADAAFEPRFALSLARSCITSVRVVIEAGHAAALLRRGVRLLRQAAQP